MGKVIEWKSISWGVWRRPTWHPPKVDDYERLFPEMPNYFLKGERVILNVLT